MSSDFAFSESAELGWKIGHKNRNGEEFVICFRDESCKYFFNALMDDGEITNCYHILFARFSFEMTHCMYVFVTQEVDYHYNSLDIIWLLFKKLRGF